MSSFWVGSTIRLRALEPDDDGKLQRFDQDVEYARNTWLHLPPRPRADYRVETTRGGVPQPDTFILGIETLSGDQLVGTVGTHTVDHISGTFGVGAAIGREYQRRGYAGEAILIVLRFMFNDRRYQKCNAFAWDSNHASIALIGKLGFAGEGRIRRSRFFGGRYHDELRFGMTVEEYTAQHEPSLSAQLEV